tara:strand:- start:191 stop:637 length:447 start_codon:yes stop_codon:yes gene_type:complete
MDKQKYYRHKTGVIAGNFDVLHPGYIKLFKECKENCDRFVVLLHADPSVERPSKLKPILSVEERIEMLTSLRTVDDVLTYNLEAELHELISLLKPDVRFLGEDYKDKGFTGDDLPPRVHWISRDHGWSTTRFKTMIAQSIFNIQTGNN